MNRYSYKLHRQDKPDMEEQRFRRSELEKMTTYQLREICRREKLIKNVLHPLDQEELIRLILRYRGRAEANYITEYREDGMERLKDLLSAARCVPGRDKGIHMPAKLTIYEDLAVDIPDGYRIRAEEPLYEGNMLLVDGNNRIMTIFSLTAGGTGEYYLTKEAQMPVEENGSGQYSILYFEERESDLLWDFYYGHKGAVPASLPANRIPILDFTVKKTDESDSPLVIDFGSSNTTAGIYTESGEFRLVTVSRRQGGMYLQTPIIPSVIGVKALCEDDIRYVFGYEADAMLSENYLDEDLPVFYDIKRFMSDASRKEKILAADGHHLLLGREEMLKAYLKFILAAARQRFKTGYRVVDLLTPIRQKEKFRRIFQKLLKPLEVRCDLDEGTAVLFCSIHDLIERGKEQKDAYEQQTWYRALILDCGGGTTDLTSGRFRIDNHRVAYTVEMETTYENGDTNFGGNNLTYRILQLLKIRLSENQEGRPAQHFACFNRGIYRMVDEEGIQKVYEDLKEAYGKAETEFPTRFQEYENKSIHEYFRIKSNYYSLFKTAEKIKKSFFSDPPSYELSIGTDPAKGADIYLDKWKLSLRDGQGLVFLPPMKENLIIRLYEIEALLRADIYGLMKRFLDKMFRDKELMQYKLIKLSGQSCYLELFREALKEFVPGSYISGAQNRKDRQELKLDCINGALRCLRNKKFGLMNIVHRNEVGALPYEVTAYTHEQIEKVLIHSLSKEERTGFISRFMEGEQLKLFLKDAGGRSLKEYHYAHRGEAFQETTYAAINQEYPQIIRQEETDNIVNGESKYFVWASREEWGFYVLPVMRRQDVLSAGKAAFFDFEDDTWEQNFFDGSK